ncbi:MAG: lauroyl acyltransferase, partial [Sulfitobacter sp.]
MAPLASPSKDPVGRRIGHYLTNAVIVGLVRFALMIPYSARLSFVGWMVERVVGPLAGYRKRARQNLAMIWPEISDDRRDEIADRCLNNVGRSFIENYSPREFPDRMAKNTPTGAGVSALEQAAATGRAVILVTGHYGNYEATRACLVARGYDIGGLYRDMKNPYFNAHYVKTME